MVKNTAKTEWVDSLIRWNDFNPFSFFSNEQGIGHGERKLAWELGGTVKGKTCSFDILCRSNEKWEVKFVGDGDEILSSATGIHAYSSARHLVDAVIIKMSRLVPAIRSIDESAGQQITEFIDQHAGMILRGELSRGRLFGSKNCIGLLNAMFLVATFVKTVKTECQVKLSIGEDTFMIDTSTYSSIMKMVNHRKDDLTHNMQQNDELPFSINDELFDNPEKLIESFVSLLRPSLVFADLTGIAIVDPLGYELIDISSIDEFFEFNRITRCRPCFKRTSWIKTNEKNRTTV